jgi:hypothetical protein
VTDELRLLIRILIKVTIIIAVLGAAGEGLIEALQRSN